MNRTVDCFPWQSETEGPSQPPRRGRRKPRPSPPIEEEVRGKAKRRGFEMLRNVFDSPTPTLPGGEGAGKRQKRNTKPATE